MAKAVELYIKSAKQGNERAQYNLAICYEEGSGVERSMKKAVQWYKESAEQGFSPAQYNIAICYLEGNGTRKNLPKAVEWLKRAAKQGYEKPLRRHISKISIFAAANNSITISLTM